MPLLININGSFCTGDEARIPVMDRGFLYGDSVYEAIRTYKGKPFALPEHLDRLERSAARLDLHLPERSWLTSEILRSIETAFNPESHVRIVVTRGGGPLTLDPTTAEKPLTVIIVKSYEPPTARMYEHGIKVVIPSIRRNPPAALDPAIKSGNYLNSVLALGEARRGGFDDAIMLDLTGRVTEATSANVFTFRGGTLYTPALETGILEGITRKYIIQIARDIGLPCEANDLYTADLQAADEIMLTSTLKEALPVVQVGDHIVGTGKPGAITKQLRDRFRDFALQRVRDES